MKKVILATLVTSGLLFATSGEELTQKFGCMACHNNVGPKLAPSFAGIGNKNKQFLGENAIDGIKRGINNGSKGKYGKFTQYIMPAYSNIKDENLDKIAKYIISLAPQAQCLQKNTTNASGTMGNQGMMKRGMKNRPTFANFDLNSDSIVTKEELTKFREVKRAKMASLGMPMRNAANAPAFESMDLNNDGTLTQDEFSKFRTQKMQQRMGNQGMMKRGMMKRGMMNRPTFANFDLNGDGMISKDEFNKFRMQRMQQNFNNK